MKRTNPVMKRTYFYILQFIKCYDRNTVTIKIQYDSQAIPVKFTNSYNRNILSDFHILVSWPIFNIICLLNGLKLGGTLSVDMSFSDLLPEHWSIFILFWIQIKFFEKFTNNNLKPDGALFYCFLYVSFLLTSIVIMKNILGLVSHTIDIRSAIISAIDLSLQIIILTAVDYSSYLQRKYTELQLSLKEKELLAIKLRSKPHFIYNTLNLIATEISSNPQLAEELIYDLGDILRAISRHSEHTRISLHEEIEIINKYIEIQKKRFNLIIDLNISQQCNALNTKLPPLLILPLIENIFKHGIHRYSNANRISLLFSKPNNSELYIKVFNDIDCFAPIIEPGEGDGLKLIIETLQLNYPNSYSFNLIRTDNYTQAEIIIKDEIQ